jgi:phospholipid-binding lipoprotein MlaA
VRPLSLQAILLITTLLLSACYTTAPDIENPRDPLEHLNRDAQRFNDKMDKAVFKPIAKGYRAITPYVLRRGVSNFFSNLGEVPTFANDVLQLRVGWALSDFWRFIFNTTIGIGGLFDVAKHMGLKPHKNDFGLTLNRWHIYTPYLILPGLGPNNVGSAISIPVDYHMSLWCIVPLHTTVALLSANMINERAELLRQEENIRGLIFDPYIFYRNAYLQYRAHLQQINANGPYFPGYASHH